MGIRIDALDAGLATRDHEIPAMKDGATVKLTAGQILDLIIGAAPGALNTLEELAAALADDENFATTVTNALALKSDKSDTDIHTLTAKTTPVDADELRIADSAASFAHKRLTFANLKAWVRSFLPLSASYESPEQTISNAGSLTLAHGLGTAPKLVQPYLICKTAELGYSIGDLVAINNGISGQGSNHGHSLIVGATNLLVRFAANTEVFIINRRDTGVATTITLANWRYIVRAWA